MSVLPLSSITITEYNDTHNRRLVDIFAPHANDPWAILFDNCDSTKSDGRFSIMLWQPVRTVTAYQGQTRTHCLLTNKNEEIDSPPFEAAEHFLHSMVKPLSIAPSAPDIANVLPFMIGVAGMAGYDTGRYYEALPSYAESHYQTEDFAAGLYLYSLIEDNLTGKMYYCSADGTTIPNLRTFDSVPKADNQGFRLTSDWQSNLSKETYIRCIEKIHDYLKAGDCYQVNFAQRFTAGFSGSVWQAYEALRVANQAPFSAYMKLGNSSIASISPERFLKVVNKIVETKPIKGTRPRFADKEEDAASASSLLTAEKDRAENLMIVDLLRNDISKHCVPHSVTVPSLFALESYEAVHHLVSTVTGVLHDNVSPLKLLASAFPGGSITGAPKIRAMEVIDELEIHRRNIYCGSMFYMGFREDLDSSICIRTLLAEKEQIHCWAGGGIVLDSVPEDEFQETLDKVSKILPVLSSQFGSNSDKD